MDPTLWRSYTYPSATANVYAVAAIYTDGVYAVGVYYTYTESYPVYDYFRVNDCFQHGSL